MKFKSIQEIVNHINRGGRVRTLGTVTGHTKGTILEGMPRTAYVNGANAYVTLPNGQAQNWNTMTVEAIEETREDIQKSVKDHLKEVQVLNSKIEYLEEIGEDKFDEREFRVWNAIQILNTKKTDLEKSKIIAELIN